MEASCYDFNTGQALDLDRLTSVKELKRVQGTSLLAAQYGDLRVLVFPVGVVRAFVPGKDVNILKNTLIATGVKVVSLLGEIRKAGYGFDESDVFSKGVQSSFDYATPQGVRPTLGADEHADLIRELVFAPYDLGQAFQIERNAVQAGENIGRKIARSVKDQKQLFDSVFNYMKGHGIGVASVRAEKDPLSGGDMWLVRVDECVFAAGITPINVTVCHFVRGLVRGAIAAFMELENVEVKEERCWGIGDTYCEFRARIFTR
jgi:predicted hydrocarbon binding protein